MRYLALAFAAITLVSCSRDPNYLKQMYLQSGMKYYDHGRYKDASIMFRKSIQEDRKFGLAYYHLALTDLKENQITVQKPDGDQVTYDPSRLRGITAYREIERPFLMLRSHLSPSASTHKESAGVSEALSMADSAAR